jgi:hypothetical protein
MPVITVNRVMDKKRLIGKKWRAEEEEGRWRKYCRFFAQTTASFFAKM